MSHFAPLSLRHAVALLHQYTIAHCRVVVLSRHLTNCTNTSLRILASSNELLHIVAPLHHCALSLRHAIAPLYHYSLSRRRSVSPLHHHTNRSTHCTIIAPNTCCACATFDIARDHAAHLLQPHRPHARAENKGQRCSPEAFMLVIKFSNMESSGQ